MFDVRIGRTLANTQLNYCYCYSPLLRLFQTDISAVITQSVFGLFFGEVFGVPVV